MDFETVMYERGNWFVELRNEWPHLFSQCNWYTFHPIFFEIENEVCMGGFEVTFIFMGLGFRWRWNYTMTEKRQHVLDMREEMENDPNWFENHCTPVSVKDINKQTETD